jgi:hypothetical protein
MEWTKIKTRYFTSAEPLITLNNNRFSFNSMFSKIVELEKNQYVTYLIDEENLKIGFEFKNFEEQDSFKVVLNKTKGNYCQSNELFSKKWIQKVSKLREVNRFKPVKDGKIYVITLMPVFENSVKRDQYLKISAEVNGIYRYLDKGNIVYIGKGNIRNRLKELSRKDWVFDTIEYSNISSDDLQYE